MGGAFQDLSGEMGCKGHNLASHKGVSLFVSRKTQRWTFEQGSQVERRQSVENNDFVSRIGIDRLIQREVSSVVVISEIKGRAGCGKRMREAGYEFLEIGFALCGGNWRSWAIVVVE